MLTTPSILAVLLAAAQTAQPPSPPAAPDQTLSLEEAVQRALQRSPSVQVAQEEIDRAEGLLREVRSGSFPTLTGNGVYTRLDSDRLSQSGAVTIPKNQLQANLSLSLPLLAPQRWVQWAHAGDNLDLARLSAEDVRRSVAVATARAYLAVFAQHRLVAINERSVANARDHLEYAKARFDAGTGNRLDVVRAGQETATAASQVANAQLGLSRAKEALGVLVADEGPVDTVEQVPLPAPPTPEAALQEAQAQRRDVKAAEKRLEAARNILHDSYADYLPLLTANVQPFAQSSATLTSPTTGWQASLVLSIPFYDGGLRYGQQRERSALAAEAKSQLDGLLRQARSEVRVAFNAVQRADEALVSAQEASKLSREALEITQLAYKAGATNDLEVVDAERRARDADSQALVSEDAARQARIDLLTASGRFP